VDLCDLALLLALALRFTDVAAELCLGDVDPCLVKVRVKEPIKGGTLRLLILAWFVAPSWALRLRDSK
jgi:hypothetical protein